MGEEEHEKEDEEEDVDETEASSSIVARVVWEGDRDNVSLSFMKPDSDDDDIVD